MERKEGERLTELDLKHKAKTVNGKKKSNLEINVIGSVEQPFPFLLPTTPPWQARAPDSGLITPIPHSYLFPPGMKVVLETNKVFRQQ